MINDENEDLTSAERSGTIDQDEGNMNHGTLGGNLGVAGSGKVDEKSSATKNESGKNANDDGGGGVKNG
jgi:hypothetical protein